MTIKTNKLRCPQESNERLHFYIKNFPSSYCPLFFILVRLGNRPTFHNQCVWPTLKNLFGWVNSSPHINYTILFHIFPSVYSQSTKYIVILDLLLLQRYHHLPSPNLNKEQWRPKTMFMNAKYVSISSGWHYHNLFDWAQVPIYTARTTGAIGIKKHKINVHEWAIVEEIPSKTLSFIWTKSRQNNARTNCLGNK